MALRNQPYLPLYVQDFMTDEKLNECSAESVGVYIRIMCVMHKSNPYGTIMLKQKDKQNESNIINFACKLQRQMSYQISVIERAVSELVDEGVLTIEGDTMYQKRMVNDGKLSDIRASAGKKGGIKTQSKDNFAKAKTVAKSQANSEYEIATVIDNDTYNVPTGSFISDSEMDTLADGLHSVLDASKRAGFPDTQADWDKCNALVAEYGADAMLAAITTCADYPMDKRNWRYLRGILKKDPTGGTREREDDSPRLPPMIGV